jgi:hypothetical protein
MKKIGEQIYHIIPKIGFRVSESCHRKKSLEIQEFPGNRLSPCFMNKNHMAELIQSDAKTFFRTDQR